MVGNAGPQDTKKQRLLRGESKQIPLTLERGQETLGPGPCRGNETGRLPPGDAANVDFAATGNRGGNLPECNKRVRGVCFSSSEV